MEVIGTTMNELSQALLQVENSLKHGQWGTINFVTEDMPTDIDLEEAYQKSVAKGMHISKFRAAPAGNGLDAYTVSVDIRKGSPVWTVLVIPVAVIVGLIIFAVAGKTIAASVSGIVVPILLIGVGGAVAIAAIAGKSPETVKYIAGAAR